MRVLPVNGASKEDDILSALLFIFFRPLLAVCLPFGRCHAELKHKIRNKAGEWLGVWETIFYLVLSTKNITLKHTHSICLHWNVFF